MEIHENHKPNNFTDSYNVDSICPECVDIAWDEKCINCNLLQRDCYGQEHQDSDNYQKKFDGNKWINF